MLSQNVLVRSFYDVNGNFQQQFVEGPNHPKPNFNFGVPVVSDSDDELDETLTMTTCKLGKF